MSGKKRPNILANRYKVLSELGRGGMGLILLTHDQLLDRELAVKTVISGTKATARARFIEEAQITGQLAHPNIVTVHELGLDGEELFLAMKLVKGRDLKEIIDALAKRSKTVRRRYSLRRLLRILLKVCEAMAYAHDQGVIHRDLKPANIMLGDADGDEVLVMDWGLAKPIDGLASSEGEESKSSVRSELRSGVLEASGIMTQEGAIMGTPAYMPPEQAENDPSLDQRADVYALGAILYELLAHRPPYTGGAMQVVNSLFKGSPPRPSEVAPENEVPPAVESIMLKAMARRRDDRYTHALAMAADIEAYLDGRAVSVHSEGFVELAGRLARQHKRLLLIAGAAAIVVALALGVSLKITLGRAELAQAREGIALLADRGAELELAQAALAGRLAEEVERLGAPVVGAYALQELEQSLLPVPDILDRHRGVVAALEMATKEARAFRRELLADPKLRDRSAALTEALDAVGEPRNAAARTELAAMRRKVEDRRKAGEGAITEAIEGLIATLSRARIRADAILSGVLVSRQPALYLERLPSLELGPERVFFQARALARLGRLDDANALLKPVVKAPDRYSKRPSFLATAAALEAVLRREPVAPSARQVLAAINRALGARESAGAAGKSVGNNGWLYWRRAEAHIILRRDAEAVRDFERALSLDRVDAWVRAAYLEYVMTFYTSGSAVGALVSVMEAIAPGFKDFGLLARTMRIWGQESGLYHGMNEKKVQALAEDMLARKEISPLGAHLRIAQAHLIVRNAKLVVEHARLALAEDPLCREALGLQAEGLLLEGMSEEAGKAARKGLQRYPEDSRLNYVRGAVLLGKERPREARPYLNRGLAGCLDPYRAQLLAMCFVKRPSKGGYAEAIEAARLALSLDNFGQGFYINKRAWPKPGDPVFQETLGRIFEANNEHARAALHYMRAAHQSNYMMRAFADKKYGRELAERRRGETILAAGAAHERLGLIGEAASLYQQLVGLKNAAGQEARRRVKRLRGGR